MTNFERITVDPAKMGGVPCIRNLRIPVATVLRLLAGGANRRFYPNTRTSKRKTFASACGCAALVLKP